MLVSTTIWRRLLLLALAGLPACSSNSNPADAPVATARAQNEEKIKGADITRKQLADADFLVKTASNGLLEQELAKLAQVKASTVVLRAYGSRLLQSRRDMLGALHTLAAAKQLAVPANMGKNEQTAYHEVAKLVGPAQDKQLLETLVRALKKDRDAFGSMEKDAYDGDIRAFAARYGQPVRDQLAAAEATQKAIEN